MVADEVRKVFLEQGEGSIKNCIRQAIWEASRAPLELSEKAKRQFITMFELELELLDCSTYSNDDRAHWSAVP